MAEYYHFTNISFSIDKEYKSKKNNPYFGDYEKLFEKYRPKNKNSRINSFFLVKKKDLYFGEQFGDIKYEVEGHNVIGCSLFWNSALQMYCQNEGLVKGFKSHYGYLLEKPNKEQSLIIKEIIENYFNGVIPKTTDYRKYNIEKDAETSVIEYLAPTIRVVKRFN